MGTINTHSNVPITLRVMLPRVKTLKLEFDKALAIAGTCSLWRPFRSTFGRFVVPRAALRDVPSLRSALG